MPRPSTITQSHVDAICQRLLESGRTPTLRLIVAEHGSGSQSTVQPLLQDWRRRRQEQAPAAPESALSDDVLKVLTKQFTHDVRVAKAVLQDQLEASEEANANLARENAALAAQVAQGEAELALLGEQVAVARGHVAQLQQELEQLRAQYDAERSARITAAQAAAASAAQCEALERQAAIQQQRLADLITEHGHCAERDRRNAEELTSRRIAIEACNARLEAAVRTNESLRADTQSARQAERIAVETAAELRGQLHAAQEALSKASSGK